MPFSPNTLSGRNETLDLMGWSKLTRIVVALILSKVVMSGGVARDWAERTKAQMARIRRVRIVRVKVFIIVIPFD